MSDMIERVARAIEQASQPPGQKDYKILMENCARAAIEAMREPTGAMIEAEPDGDGEWDKTNSAACAKEFWQAMIDAALNEKSPTP